MSTSGTLVADCSTSETRTWRSRSVARRELPMEFISPVDALFLVAESREHPMHVGSLSIFDPVDGCGPEFARRAYAALAADEAFHPMFRKRPARLFGTPQLAWTVDRAVELDYHVQRRALPGPGGLDALTEVAAGLHSTLLDRHRPLWEAHLIEGLAGDRVGLYSKIHHALIDGVGAQRLLQRTLTPSPAKRWCPGISRLRPGAAKTRRGGTRWVAGRGRCSGRRARPPRFCAWLAPHCSSSN
jgi:WS/DGAT/MGAT family acyltransferase